MHERDLLGAANHLGRLADGIFRDAGKLRRRGQRVVVRILQEVRAAWHADNRPPIKMPLVDQQLDDAVEQGRAATTHRVERELGEYVERILGRAGDDQLGAVSYRLLNLDAEHELIGLRIGVRAEDKVATCQRGNVSGRRGEAQCVVPTRPTACPR